MNIPAINNMINFRMNKNIKRTSQPLSEQEANLVLPGQQIDQQDAKDVGQEVYHADVCTRVFQLGSEQDTCPDRNNFDDTIHTAEQGGLEGGEAEGGDNDLALVGETVRDIVDGGEEGEKPGFGIVDGLPESLKKEMSCERWT